MLVAGTQSPFLTPTQVATVLGLSTATLANWRSLGRGPAYIKLGARVRYRAEDIERWVDAQGAGCSTLAPSQGIEYGAR